MADDTISIRYYLERLFKEHRHVHETERQERDSAAEALKAKLDTMNEFRAQVLEERAHYLSREVFEARIVPLERLMWGIAALVGAGVIALPLITRWVIP